MAEAVQTLADTVRHGCLDRTRRGRAFGGHPRDRGHARTPASV